MTPHVKQSNLFFDLVQDQCQQLEHVSHLSKILTSQSFSFSALLSSFWLLNQSHKSVIHPAVALHLRNQKQLWPHLLRISSVTFLISSFSLRLEAFFVVELLLSSISQLKIAFKVSLVSICTGSPPWDGRHKVVCVFLAFLLIRISKNWIQLKIVKDSPFKSTVLSVITNKRPSCTHST